MIPSIQNINYNTAVFTANYNSARLKFNREDFFVRMPNYGENLSWADEVIKIADKASDDIRQKLSPEAVLRFITDGIRRVNGIFTQGYKSSNSGILRTMRDGWKCKPDVAYTRYVNNRYSIYADRLNDVCIYPLTETPDNFAISRPVNFFEIEHGESKNINNSLDHVFDLFKKNFSKYLKHDVKTEDLPEINSNIAKIRWVLAHATPWHRGSDAISNVFMRSMYKAVGIKTYPISKGVSLDLEAYCTELPEYIRNFSKYFEKPPEIIE